MILKYLCNVLVNSQINNLKEEIIINREASTKKIIKIGNNSVIAARSGVTKDIKENSVVAGFPAVDIQEWKKNLIRQRKNGY